jgi:hypothetical protein
LDEGVLGLESGAKEPNTNTLSNGQSIKVGIAQMEIPRNENPHRLVEPALIHDESVSSQLVHFQNPRIYDLVGVRQKTLDLDFTMKDKVAGELAVFGLTHRSGEDLRCSGLNISVHTALTLQILANLGNEKTIYIGCGFL